MSNQYSYGCGYNYRRSSSRETSGQCSRENRSAMRFAEEKQAVPAGFLECPEGKWPVAMGYVPMQSWSQPLPSCKGFQIGTIFADLYKPFCGKGGAWK